MGLNLVCMRGLEAGCKSITNKFPPLTDGYRKLRKLTVFGGNDLKLQCSPGHDILTSFKKL